MSDHHDSHDIRKDVKKYIGVFVALLVLTGVTVGVSYIHFGAAGSNAGNIIVAMIIATVKAALVAAFFMHLISEKWTIYRFLLVTLFFAAGLFVLTYVAFHDHIHL